MTTRFAARQRVRGSTAGGDTMQFVTHETTDDIRRETFAGREYLVAPTVAVVESVLKGEYLPAEEIEASAPAWNGAPLPVSHPTRDGQFVTANAPETLQREVVGRFFNAEFDPDESALKGEVWVDVERSNALAENRGDEYAQPLAVLDAGDTLEVSTAYWHGRDPRSGTFNGDRYDAVQFAIKPDHLALLPNEQGECSVEDGCGAGRSSATAASATFGSGESERHLFVNMDDDDPGPSPNASDDPMTTWQRLGRTLGIGTTDDDTPAAASTEGTANACGCDGDGDGDGDPSEPTSIETMDDNIQRLAEQSAFDAETLAEWDDSQLSALEESLEGAASANDDDDSTDDGDDDVAAAINSLSETVERIDSRLDDVEERTEQAVQTQTDELVETIRSNSERFSEDELRAMETETLEKIASETAGASYAGRPGTDVGSSANDDVDAYDIPTTYAERKAASEGN